MRKLIYYMLLLVFIALVTGYILSGESRAMSMPEIIGLCGALVLYTIAMSLIGENPKGDEREIKHRNLSNRAGLIAGTIVFSVGLIYQLFITHNIDFWLLAGLIIINLTKIISLIYLENKK